MSVTEVVQALGSWSVTLAEETPREVLDQLGFFSHVAIVPGRLNPAQYGDTLLTMARYVGVVTGREFDQAKRIKGQGMAVWLGDADDKGEVFEAPVSINGLTFPNAIRALLGSGTAVIEGTLYSVAGMYTGVHQWQSRRKAIDYVCGLMGAEWRVNGNATLDAGPASNLYVANPSCVIVRKGAGRDLTLSGLPGDIQLTRDVEDWTSRVVLLAEGQGDAVATGSADIGSNPYLDLRGGAVRRTRLISESGTATGNAQSRAQLQLNRFVGTRNALRLSAQDYEIDGSFRPGDWVWVYDPESGLVDTNNEIIFRGERFNPIKLRAVETTWPIVKAMTVACRTQAGVWVDLTDYVTYEVGQTSITVGELSRSLTGADSEPVGGRPIPDSTIPGTVTWVTPFGTSVYLDGLGYTRARIIVAWNLPLNADGSTILDGDHYEIGYGVTPAASWETAYAAWGDLQAVVNDLSPGVTYDFRIRAVDAAGNAGAWSATVSATANPDTIPPSTPAPPTVAASLIAIQVSHTLGKASGGVFNLERDLDHLEVHVGATSGFTTDATTLRGQVPANAGMMQAGIAAVGTVPESNTTLRHVKVIAVDMAGNRSAASASATTTALLIDDAHISDLTVTKVTAGTISANWLIGASIRTASSGQRVELTATGLHGFNAGGIETVSLLNSGSFTLRSAATGARVELDTSGFRAYNSGGTQTVGLSNSGSFFLQSGTSGARMVLDVNGIELFNASGNKTVEFNTSDGTALIVGRVSSSETDQKRLVINPGPSADSFEPEIRMYEEYDLGEYHYWTTGAPGAHVTEIGSANLSGHRSSLTMSQAGYYLANVNSDGSRYGGFINADGTSSFEISLHNQAGLLFTNNALVHGHDVILQPESSGGVYLKGKITTADSASAVAGGKVAANGTGGTVIYGPSYDGTPYPAATVRAGNVASFVITNVSPSSFNWSWNGPALSSGADHINWFGRKE
jgi:hypothetical protein